MVKYTILDGFPQQVIDSFERLASTKEELKVLSYSSFVVYAVDEPSEEGFIQVTATGDEETGKTSDVVYGIELIHPEKFPGHDYTIEDEKGRIWARS